MENFSIRSDKGKKAGTHTISYNPIIDGKIVRELGEDDCYLSVTTNFGAEETTIWVFSKYGQAKTQAVRAGILTNSEIENIALGLIDWGF